MFLSNRKGQSEPIKMWQPQAVTLHTALIDQILRKELKFSLVESILWIDMDIKTLSKVPDCQWKFFCQMDNLQRLEQKMTDLPLSKLSHDSSPTKPIT